MIIFRYDKTFDGILTTIFDAYERKTFPDKLLGMDDIEPMFTSESHTVHTDKTRAERVWKGLQKKLSKHSINMLYAVWLSEEEESDYLIFKYIKKVFDAPYPIENNFSDDDILKATQLAKKVNREAEQLRQFVRLQKTSDGTYFAPVDPIFNALPLAIGYFKDRFSDQKWIIYDLRRKYGFFFDTKKVIEITLEGEGSHLLTGKLDDELMASDEKLFQELWKSYFKSMTIKERINPKLHKQHMPKRFWKYLTEKQLK